MKKVILNIRKKDKPKRFGSKDDLKRVEEARIEDGEQGTSSAKSADNVTSQSESQQQPIYTTSVQQQQIPSELTRPATATASATEKTPIRAVVAEKKAVKRSCSSCSCKCIVFNMFMAIVVLGLLAFLAYLLYNFTILEKSLNDSD